MPNIDERGGEKQTATRPTLNVERPIEEAAKSKNQKGKTPNADHLTDD